MERKCLGPGYSNLKAGQDDLKLHIRRLIDYVALGILDNREMASDVKHLVTNMRHVSYQISCHDSRINDHDRDLRELIGSGNG